MELLFIIFLSWLFLTIGSFLNVVAYRLVHPVTFFANRSFCPHCKQTIAWYDLVPVLSWLFLRGACRSCKQSISWLYPFIELLTLICFWLLILTQPIMYWFSYSICIAALIVTIRTDLETMLISRFTTLFLIPLIWFFILIGWLPINFTQSIAGIALGAGFLWLTGFIFQRITGKVGMGQGDVELLAFIGSFLGPIKCWLALLIGSISGSIVGILMLAIATRSWNRVMPFGPFLALGALYALLAAFPWAF